MALRPPGSRSNIDLVTYGALALVQVLLLISGHVLAGYIIMGHFGIGKGMADILEFTGLPEWSIWLTITATIAMDAWIIYLKREERRKALKR